MDCLIELLDRPALDKLALLCEILLADFSTLDFLSENQLVSKAIDRLDVGESVKKYLRLLISESDYILANTEEENFNVRFETLYTCTCDNCPKFDIGLTFVKCGQKVDGPFDNPSMGDDEISRLLNFLGFTAREVKNLSLAWQTTRLLTETEISNYTNVPAFVCKNFMLFMNGLPAQHDYLLKFTACGCGLCPKSFEVRWSHIDNVTHVSPIEGVKICTATYKKCPVKFYTKFSWMENYFMNVETIESDDPLHHILPTDPRRLSALIKELNVSGKFFEALFKDKLRKSEINKFYGMRKTMIIIRSFQIMRCYDKDIPAIQWHVYNDKKVERKANEIVKKVMDLKFEKLSLNFEAMESDFRLAILEKTDTVNTELPQVEDPYLPLDISPLADFCELAEIIQRSEKRFFNEADPEETKKSHVNSIKDYFYDVSGNELSIDLINDARYDQVDISDLTLPQIKKTAKERKLDPEDVIRDRKRYLHLKKKVKKYDKIDLRSTVQPMPVDKTKDRLKKHFSNVARTFSSELSVIDYESSQKNKTEEDVIEDIMIANKKGGAAELSKLTRHLRRKFVDLFNDSYDLNFRLTYGLKKVRKNRDIVDRVPLTTNDIFERIAKDPDTYLPEFMADYRDPGYILEERNLFNFLLMKYTKMFKKIKNKITRVKMSMLTPASFLEIIADREIGKLPDRAKKDRWNLRSADVRRLLNQV